MDPEVARPIVEQFMEQVGDTGQYRIEQRTVGYWIVKDHKGRKHKITKANGINGLMKFAKGIKRGMLQQLNLDDAKLKDVSVLAGKQIAAVLMAYIMKEVTLDGTQNQLQAPK
jgi:hypothetical protein